MFTDIPVAEGVNTELEVTPSHLRKYPRHAKARIEVGDADISIAIEEAAIPNIRGETTADMALNPGLYCLSIGVRSDAINQELTAEQIDALIDGLTAVSATFC